MLSITIRKLSFGIVCPYARAMYNMNKPMKKLSWKQTFSFEINHLLRSLLTPGATFYSNNRFSLNSAFCFPISL